MAKLLLAMGAVLVIVAIMCPWYLVFLALIILYFAIPFPSRSDYEYPEEEERGQISQDIGTDPLNSWQEEIRDAGWPDWDDEEPG